MSSRLKPCPFCGATPAERHTVTAGGYRLIAITCPDCKAWGPLVEIDYQTGDERSIAPAVAAWNSRVPTERHLSDMQVAMEEYREITDRLQQCVQRHRLGLGGERIDVLVCDEVDRLRAAHQERDADARRLDWLEGWMQDGCFQMDMMDLCYGSDSVRAAIDAARAPADTQTEGNDAS